MKKLLAIFLSALLLCTMIPFATISADDEPTIVVSTVKEANAGDEIEVEVYLMNNPGVISAIVEIDYDKDVMELVSYYDEDEETDLNMIEVASGWSSKYITFGPLGKCLVSFINGLASKNVTKELFYTATFKIKEDAVSGTYPLTVVYNPKNFVNVSMEYVTFGSQDTSITINGTDPEPEVITFGGNSVAETEDGLSGLAFKFDVTDRVEGLAIVDGTNYVADYGNAYVTPDSTGTYKLVKMGAVVSNNRGITELDFVDGRHVVNVEAKNLNDVDSDPYYYVRIINIPEFAYDTYITARPYYVYENAEGEQIVVYGYEEMATINGVLEG